MIKNIPFKTKKSESFLPADGRRIRIICGDIRHCTLFIPFKLFIEIPGAQPGDECEVVKAKVTGEVDTLFDDTGDGFFDRLVETINIHVEVRVTRPVVMKVNAARRIATTNFVRFNG